MVNKVILIGNLGDDPENRAVGDTSVTNIRIATNETYKDKSGEKKTDTEWHSVELWGGLAKVSNQYLKKGSMVYIEGKIKTEQWQDSEGNNRRNVKIRANSMTMLDKKGTPLQQPQTKQAKSTAPAAIIESSDDSLPF